MDAIDASKPSPSGAMSQFNSTLAPDQVPIPLPVERAMVLRAAARMGAALNDVLRYLQHGPNSGEFAFQNEVITDLADALGILAEIELPRLRDSSVITDAEVSSIIALQSAIHAYQKEWGCA